METFFMFHTFGCNVPYYSSRLHRHCQLLQSFTESHCQLAPFWSNTVHMLLLSATSYRKCFHTMLSRFLSANICEKVAIHMQTTSQSQSQTNKRKKALNQNRIEPVNKSVTWQQTNTYT